MKSTFEDRLYLRWPPMKGKESGKKCRLASTEIHAYISHFHPGLFYSFTADKCPCLTFLLPILSSPPICDSHAVAAVLLPHITSAPPACSCGPFLRACVYLKSLLSTPVLLALARYPWKHSEADSVNLDARSKPAEPCRGRGCSERRGK